MTTNKPEVLAYHHTNKEKPEHRGVSLHHDASCTSTLTNTEPLIRLSDYEALQAECERLRCIIRDLKDWDCDVRGGFLSIPVDLRRRMQEALDSARHEPGHDSDGMVE